MSLELPKPIAAYFNFDKSDVDAFARCFNENAVVVDEGKTHNGLAEIKQWKAGASARYTYTSEPFASELKEGKTVVTSHIAGNFPGNPIDLRFIFGLEGGKIASLEIVP